MVMAAAKIPARFLIDRVLHMHLGEWGLILVSQ